MSICMLKPHLKLIFTPEFFFRYTKFWTRIAGWGTYFFRNDMTPFNSFIDWTLEFFGMAISDTIITFWVNLIFYFIAGSRSNIWKIATIMLQHAISTAIVGLSIQKRFLLVKYLYNNFENKRIWNIWIWEYKLLI